MHHLSQGSKRHSLLSQTFPGCQALVRFFGYHRIKEAGLAVTTMGETVGETGAAGHVPLQVPGDEGIADGPSGESRGAVDQNDVILRQIGRAHV